MPNTPPPLPVDPENDPNHSTNFCFALFYYCSLRVGWIFKTESIVMPAVLDTIGGAGWLRGFLPMLNRLGQSVPPFLASDWVRSRRYKKWVLVASSCTMGGCFLVLSWLWSVTGGKPSWYLPILFLACYGVFFVATGINQLVVNTLIGKLIRVRRRGLLALVGTALGAGLAVICAYLLLHRWLPDNATRAEDYRFDWIFGFTGCMFAIGGLSAIFWRERPDDKVDDTRKPLQLMAVSWTSLREDKNLLLLAVIAGLFGMSITLFPHYQRLGRDRFDLGLTALIPWVLAQNIGAALFSIPAGWIADRLGTRLALRILLLLVCIAPALAMVLTQIPTAGKPWYTLVFGLLGATPVAIRIFNYYTLEIAGRSDHPRYLSTLSLAMAGPPFLFSIVLGALVDRISFEFVFVVVTVCMVIGWLLTFRLIEPRHKPQPPSA